MSDTLELQEPSHASHTVVRSQTSGFVEVEESLHSEEAGIKRGSIEREL